MKGAVLMAEDLFIPVWATGTPTPGEQPIYYRCSACNVEIDTNQRNNHVCGETVGIELPPMGGIIQAQKLAYMPIGGGTYAINWNGKRSLASTIKRGKRFICSFEAGGNIYTITQPVITKTEYLQVPLDFWSAWANENLQAIEGSLLVARLICVLQVYNEAPRSQDVLCEAIPVLASWTSEWLCSIPRVKISAGKNCGKTAHLETIAMLSKCGRFESDISAAAFARSQQMESPAWCIDELDAIIQKKNNNEDDDNPLAQLFRQGYRRGAVYTRANKNGSVTSFPIFSVGAFTAIKDVEDMLESRTLKVELEPSNDTRLPILHSATSKRLYLAKLKCDFYTWYMEQWANPTPTFSESMKFKALPGITFDGNNGGVDAAREQIVVASLAGMTAHEQKFIKGFTSRAEELALSLVSMGRIFGFSEADYTGLGTLLSELQTDLSMPAEGLPGLLYQILASKFRGQKIGYKVEQQVVFKEISEQIGRNIGDKSRRGLLREAHIPASALLREATGRWIFLNPELQKVLGLWKEQEKLNYAANAANDTNVGCMDKEQNA